MDPAISVNSVEISGKGTLPGAEARMLVHTCCGPCSVYPIKKMLEGRVKVQGYFFNPNIHPYSEFKKRLEAVKRLSSLLSVDIICEEDYTPTLFIDRMKKYRTIGEGGIPAKGARCMECYAMRLRKTAEKARALGFESFTTSLLYSRFQMHDEIKEIGRAVADDCGIRFFYDDFRPGWRQGIDESKAMGLFRQRYCGCVYSRMERDNGKRKNP